MKVHTPEVCEHTHTHTPAHLVAVCPCADHITLLCLSLLICLMETMWCYLPPGSCADQTGWPVQNASTVLPTPTPNPKLRKQQPTTTTSPISLPSVPPISADRISAPQYGLSPRVQRPSQGWMQNRKKESCKGCVSATSDRD